MIGEMDKKEFEVICRAINGNWKNCIDNPDTRDVWYSRLKDLDYIVCSNAVGMLMDTMHDYPKIADIRKAAAELFAPVGTYMTPQEAWAYIERAICDGYYHAQERYDKLPAILKKCTSPEQIHTLAMDEDYNPGVESSNFFKTYYKVVNEEKEFNQLNPKLQELMLSTSDRTGIEVKQDGLS